MGYRTPQLIKLLQFQRILHVFLQSSKFSEDEEDDVNKHKFLKSNLDLGTSPLGPTPQNYERNVIYLHYNVEQKRQVACREKAFSEKDCARWEKHIICLAECQTSLAFLNLLMENVAGNTKRLIFRDYSSQCVHIWCISAISSHIF